MLKPPVTVGEIRLIRWLRVLIYLLPCLIMSTVIWAILSAIFGDWKFWLLGVFFSGYGGAFLVAACINYMMMREADRF